MKKYLLVAAILCLVVLTVNAQVKLYSGKWLPECVASDGKFLYVSNIGKKLDPTTKDGDGAIRKFTLKGELIDSAFCKSPLNAPKGMTIVGATLYVTDVDEVLGVDLKSGNITSRISFTSLGIHFLNDLEKKDDHTLWVTATDTNSVCEILLSEVPKISVLEIPPIVGANGLSYDQKQKRLYVAGFGTFASARGEGKFGYVEWVNKKPVFTVVNGVEGFFDGVAVVDDHTVLISDWVDLAKPAGVVKLVNVKTQETKVLPASVLGGPADFYYDKTTKQLIIPTLIEGGVVSLNYK